MIWDGGVQLQQCSTLLWGKKKYQKKLSDLILKFLNHTHALLVKVKVDLHG